jgi:hypothetical protein
MTDPSRPSPAGAGLTLVATVLPPGGAGKITGLSAGAVAGFALVCSRFRDI